jgi:hypothetical protein
LELEYFSQLTRIKHLGDIEDYNLEFQVLAKRVDDISDEHFLEAYMGGLKEYIKHDLFLKHLENIMQAMQFSHHFQSKNKDTHKSTIGAYLGSRDRFGLHNTIIPQLLALDQVLKNTWSYLTTFGTATACQGRSATRSGN